MIAGYYDAATNTINGINDRGQIVGFYVAAGGNTDGFVGSKQPLHPQGKRGFVSFR
jgi:hypothetical protein